MAGDVPIRPAATVILLRDGTSGLETFLLRRAHQIDFASGAMVFPGGKVDPTDVEARPFCDGLDEIEVDRIDFHIAAAREAFEEAGVLFARRAGEREIASGPWVSELEPWRVRLADGSASMAEFCLETGLRIACDCLVPYSRWVTPPAVAKRFDTWFFVARTPAGQALAHDGGEAVDSEWITPQNLLARRDAGKALVLFPTRLTLLRLALAADADEAVAAAADLSLDPIMPDVELRDGEKWLTIPEEAGYPLSEVRLADEMHRRP